jgi:alkanesulfonate monooxygenase SsuD/methylene tetrahydromethanopterin reductase-like flavin-dependent oxidoreductase (luciferase family)
VSEPSRDASRVRAGLGTLSAQALSGSPAGAAEAIETAVAAAEVAEADGLDTVWTTEHHFAADGYLPTPLLLLASIAGRTERIELGTNVLLAPLADPVRLAEEGAVLDHLSHGRFHLGLGLGYRTVEFTAFGQQRSHRAARLETLVDVLRRAWRGEPVTGRPSGPDVVVTPSPATPGGPPILLGAFADVGVDRAGRIGDGWLAPELAHPRGLAKRIARLGLAHRDKPFHVVANLNGFVASRDATAVVAPGAGSVLAQYADWMGEAGDNRPAPLAPGELPPTFVAGNPEQCVEALRAWWQLLYDLPPTAVPHLAIRLVWPGVSRAANLESVRLFAREVVPALRAEIG